MSEEVKNEVEKTESTSGAKSKVKEVLSKKAVKYSLVGLLAVSAGGLIIGGTSTGTISTIIGYVAEIVDKLGF